MPSPRYRREIPARLRLETTRCTGCGKVPYPALPVCPSCGGRVFEPVTLSRTGRVWVKPGVESTLPLGHDLVAVFTAVPVPSKAFDDLMAAERARKAPRAS